MSAQVSCAATVIIDASKAAEEIDKALNGIEIASINTQSGLIIFCSYALLLATCLVCMTMLRASSFS